MPLGTVILLVAAGLLGAAAPIGVQTPEASNSSPTATNPTSQPAGERYIENAERMLAAHNYEQAVRYFQSAIRADPRDAQLLVRLGDAYREWGLTNDDVANSGKDIESYVKALAVDPDNIDALARVMAVYVEQVEFRHRAQDFDGLSEMAARIVQLHPKDSDLYHRAQAYAAIAPLARWLSGIAVPSQEVDDNIKALTELMKEKKFIAEVPYYLAQSYLNKAMEKRRAGQKEEAKKLFDETRAVFEQAIAAQPESARLLVRFYMVMAQANQKLQSDEDMPQAQEFLARMREVLAQARALVDTAVEQEKKGKGTEPNLSDSQQEALATYTDVYYYSVEFAGRHADMGLGKDEAMKLAEHWLEVRPGDQTARLMMAGLLEAENDPAKRAQAVALLEQPIIDPGGSGIGVLRSRRSLDLSTQLRLINLLIEQWGLTTDAAAKMTIRQKIDNTFAQFSKIVGPTTYDSKKIEGRIQLQTGGVEGAIKAVSILNQAEKIRQQAGVQDLELDWWLAQAYEKTHQTGKAEERLAKVCKMRNNFVPAHILYAKLLLKDGKLYEAGKEIAILMKLAPDMPAVKDLEIQFLERTPNDPNARNLIPELVPPYEANPTKEEAIAALEAARLATPGDFDIVQKLVSIYLSKNQKDQAQKVVDEAIKAAPDNANFKILKLSVEGASAEKIRAAQREAISQIKDELTREMRYFDYELTVGDFDAALQHLDNAEKINSNDKNVLEVRFRVSCQLKQWDRAEAVVKTATALDVDEAGGRIYEFRLAMARGDVNKALAVAQELVKKMPNFARPHLCLAQALQADKQFDAAIGEYKSAREAQNSTEALAGMISCYYALNQPGEALRCIKDGLLLSPKGSTFVEQVFHDYLKYDPDPKPDVMATLLKAGADPNAKDKDGTTLLMRAAVSPNPDVVAVLLKAGADVNAKDNSGKTALDYAQEKNNSEVAAVLIKAGAKGK